MANELNSATGTDPGGGRTVKPGFRYTGVVVANNDPNRCERVRAKIVGLTDQLPAEALPWLGNSSNQRMAGGKSGSGSSYIPDVGSKVLVVFPDTSLYNGYYLPYPTTADTTIPEAGIAYPNTPVVFRFPDGTVLFYNKPSKELCLRNPGGPLKVRLQGDFNLVCQTGNVNIEANNVTAHAKGKAMIAAQTCDIATNKFSITNYSAPATPNTGP